MGKLSADKKRIESDFVGKTWDVPMNGEIYFFAPAGNGARKTKRDAKVIDLRWTIGDDGTVYVEKLVTANTSPFWVLRTPL